MPGKGLDHGTGQEMVFINVPFTSGNAITSVGQGMDVKKIQAKSARYIFEIQIKGLDKVDYVLGSGCG